MKKNLLQLGWEVYCDQGLWSLIHHVVGELGYRRLFLLERSLSSVSPIVQARMPMTIEWLTELDSTDYYTLRPDADRDLDAERLKSGHRCLLARIEGRLVGVMWVGSGSVWSHHFRYVGYDLAFTPEEAYLFNAYADPAYRGQSIAPALSSELLHRLRDEGCTRAIRGTHPTNAPALRAHGKAGFRPFVVIHRLRFLGWRHVWRRSL